MLFNTLEFGLFLILVLGVHALLRHRGQNLLLLVASYTFYAAWDARFLILMAVSTLVDFRVAQGIGKSTCASRRRRLLILSLVVNLGILGFFKYYGFFVESLQSLLASLGITFHAWTLQVVLPVGISFYTFQSMSYTIDVYRRRLSPCRKLSDFALYVSLFPQLVAGPIERATHLLPQVEQPRHRKLTNFTEGFHLFLWGLFKKVVVADNMALIVDPIFSHEGEYTAGKVLVGVVAFAFQIYGDFSGYTDMARGVARLLGFDLMINFNLPYFATSPQDFWHRWHISLSTWLRDYLYIPLGGNRLGTARTYVNLMLTMLLGGLWHGAAWTFVIWGGYHGLLLAAQRLLVAGCGEWRPASRSLRRGWKAARMAFMFGLTLYGWLIFRAESPGQLLEMTGALLRGDFDAQTLRSLVKIGAYCSLLWVVQVWQYRTRDLLIVQKSPAWLQALFYLACFYLILIMGVFDAQAFIYFQF